MDALSNSQVADEVVVMTVHPEWSYNVQPYTWETVP